MKLFNIWLVNIIIQISLSISTKENPKLINESKTKSAVISFNSEFDCLRGIQTFKLRRCVEYQLVGVAAVLPDAPALQHRGPGNLGGDGLELEKVGDRLRLVLLDAEASLLQHLRLTHPVLDGRPSHRPDVADEAADLVGVGAGVERPAAVP